MSQVWNNNALNEGLLQVLADSPPTPVAKYLRLFTNNLTPANTDAIGSYTECGDASYNPIALTGSSWSISNVSGGRSATYPAQTFNFAAGNNLYGWYITDNPATKVYFAGNLPSPPVVVPSTGGTYALTVTLPSLTP